jgi:predicted metalloprotease
MWGDRNVDVGGVQDRRGRGMGIPIALGGGGGIAGLLLLILFQVLGGGNAASLVPSQVGTGGATESTEQLRQRCNSDGAIEQYDDCHVIKSYNELNEVWDAQFAQSGYRAPTLVFFEQGTQTGCGTASSQVGPFYCPADEGVYFDLGFLAELQQRFGAEGRYAQTYIIAHEVGHHLQHLMGAHEQAAAAAQRNPSQQQALAIGMELQADCYAGVWSALADRAGNVNLTERELDQALNAAAAVGDDRIQQKTQGRIDPESWTHGSAQQRRDAFLAGYQSADAARCRSFLPFS